MKSSSSEIPNHCRRWQNYNMTYYKLDMIVLLGNKGVRFCDDG